MTSIRKDHLTRTQAFQAVLEYLRYALATKTQVLRVVNIRPVTEPSLPTELLSTQVLIEIDKIPIEHETSGRLPIAAHAVSQFLESWQVQEQLLRWYGRQIAKNIPKRSDAAKFKKGFGNLRLGGLGKLPPKIVLIHQYDRLVFEIVTMQSRFPESSPLTKKDREQILEFGRKESAHWVRVVEKTQVDLDQILREKPKAAAKLILSKQYACSEETIHWGLFRNS